MIRRRSLLAASTGLLAAPAALAQTSAPWPQGGSIRLVPTFPPGGLVDTITRLIAQPLSQALGQTVLVENRPGAGGVIGTDFVAKQRPDGYTFLMTHASVFVYSVATLPSVPFDPIADFTHLGMLVEATSVLLVRADSPFRTLEDFLAAARRQPVRYGSSGIGSAPHMLGAMLTGAANLTQLDHVPYAGSAPAMRDLLGGTIESMIDPITTNVAAMQQGSLRALAVSAPQRLAAFPNLPTFAELGFPGLVQTQWVGMSAPRGLPAPIAERMIAAIPQLVQNPAVLERATQLVTLPRTPTPVGRDFVAVIERELGVAREVARRYNIQAAA
jgi:tripartite-type tricarboxylate transporter receptor subunit TctC